MGPSKEVVTTNCTEEGGLGRIPCANMEKGQLLCCSCKIIGIGCSCLWDHVRMVRVVRHWVVQRDHVEVTGRVFCSGENNLSILGDVHGRWTKVDGAAMGTELRNRNKG